MASKEWRQANREKERASRRAWYHRNAQRAKEKVFSRRGELRAWLKEIRVGLSCDCGENDHRVLDFHHLDPKTKRTEVSRMAHLGFSRETILDEISKCKVMCSNCHRKLERP